MYNPLHRDWLMATSRIDVSFNIHNGERAGHGSGFWMKTPNSNNIVFITNRHNIDLQYQDGTKDFKISSLSVYSFDTAGSRHSDFYVSSDLLDHIHIEVPKNPNLDIAVLTFDETLLKKLLYGVRSRLITVPVDALADEDTFANETELLGGHTSRLFPTNLGQTARPKDPYFVLGL